MGSTATLIYGLSVDPFRLLYHARAWSDNHVQLAYLNGLITGRLHQDHSRKTALPLEILSMIKQSFWQAALKNSTCESWAFFGKELCPEIHKPGCCANRLSDAESYLQDDFVESCDGDCDYISGEGAERARCECVEDLRRIRNQMMEEDLAYRFSEDAYYEGRFDAERDLESCFEKKCSIEEECARCLTLHPFLHNVGLSIMHYSTNVNTEDYREARHGCIVSVNGGKGASISHELEGGSITSILTLGSDDVRALLDQNQHLEKLAKELGLPVVPHPFVDASARAGERKTAKIEYKKKVAKMKRALPDASLYKPMFHLIADSWCDY